MAENLKYYVVYFRPNGQKAEVPFVDYEKAFKYFSSLRVFNFATQPTAVEARLYEKLKDGSFELKKLWVLEEEQEEFKIGGCVAGSEKVAGNWFKTFVKRDVKAGNYQFVKDHEYYVRIRRDQPYNNYIFFFTGNSIPPVGSRLDPAHVGSISKKQANDVFAYKSKGPVSAEIAKEVDCELSKLQTIEQTALNKAIEKLKVYKQNLIGKIITGTSQAVQIDFKTRERNTNYFTVYLKNGDSISYSEKNMDGFAGIKKGEVKPLSISELMGAPSIKGQAGKEQIQKKEEGGIVERVEKYNIETVRPLTNIIVGVQEENTSTMYYQFGVKERAADFIHVKRRHPPVVYLEVWEKNPKTEEFELVSNYVRYEKGGDILKRITFGQEEQLEKNTKIIVEIILNWPDYTAANEGTEERRVFTAWQYKSIKEFNRAEALRQEGFEYLIVWERIGDTDEFKKINEYLQYAKGGEVKGVEERMKQETGDNLIFVDTVVIIEIINALGQKSFAQYKTIQEGSNALRFYVTQPFMPYVAEWQKDEKGGFALINEYVKYQKGGQLTDLTNFKQGKRKPKYIIQLRDKSGLEVKWEYPSKEIAQNWVKEFLREETYGSHDYLGLWELQENGQYKILEEYIKYDKGGYLKGQEKYQEGGRVKDLTTYTAKSNTTRYIMQTKPKGREEERYEFSDEESAKKWASEFLKAEGYDLVYLALWAQNADGTYRVIKEYLRYDKGGFIVIATNSKKKDNKNKYAKGGKIEDSVKSFEDAAKILNIDFTEIKFLEVAGMSNRDLEVMSAQYQLIIIARALNEGWVPNWADSNEYKYYPYFEWNKKTSGFVFSSTSYGNASTLTTVGSRLCFKSEELAEYAGKRFEKIYAKLLNP